MTEVGTSNWNDFNWEIRNNNDQSYWGGRYDNYMVGWLTGYYSYGAWGDNDTDTLSAGEAYGGHWYNVGTNTLAYDHSETLDKTCVLTFQKLAYGIKATLTSEGTEVWSCLNPLCGYEKSLASIELDTSAVQKTFTKGTSPCGRYATFTKGTTFNSTGLKVTAKYDDESTADVSDSENVSVEADLSSAGTKSVTVSYTENGVTKTETYEVEVTDTVVLSSISVNTTGAKTSFAVGGTFTSDGIKVTANYSNDTTKDVSDSASVDGNGVTSDAAGIYTVTVSYTEGDVTKTAEYSVVVQTTSWTATTASEKETISPLSVSNNSDGITIDFKATFPTTQGDWASQIIGYGGIYITVPNLDPWYNTVDSTIANINNYPGSTNSILTSGYSFNSAFIGSEVEIVVTVNSTDGITYYLDGVEWVNYPISGSNGWTETQMTAFVTHILDAAANGTLEWNPSALSVYSSAKATVGKNTPTADWALSEISILTAPKKITFVTSSTFDVTGIAVTATYASGSTGSKTVDVTDRVTYTINETEYTSGTTTLPETAGTYTVTVNYTEGTVTKTTSYKITVSLAVSSIALTSGSILYTYNSGTKVLIPGAAKITVTYSNNKTAEVSASDSSIIWADVSSNSTTATYLGVQSESISVTNKTSASELLTAGVSASELLAAGVSASELLAAGAATVAASLIEDSTLLGIVNSKTISSAATVVTHITAQPNDISAAIDTETVFTSYTGTGWWAQGNTGSSDLALSNNSTSYYLVQGVDSGAFLFETIINDSTEGIALSNAYISINSSSDAWGAAWSSGTFLSECDSYTMSSSNLYVVAATRTDTAVTIKLYEYSAE